MENTKIKSAVSEQHVTGIKHKVVVNLNDVLNGTVVLPFDDKLGVMIKAKENILEILLLNIVQIN